MFKRYTKRLRAMCLMLNWVTWPIKKPITYFMPSYQL